MLDAATVNRPAKSGALLHVSDPYNKQAGDYQRETTDAAMWCAAAHCLASHGQQAIPAHASSLYGKDPFNHRLCGSPMVTCLHRT